MVDRTAGTTSLPDDWPAHPDLSLALNRMGSFDWELDSGLMHLDQSALDVFDLYADEYDGRPVTLARRVPPDEGTRLDAMVAQALKNGATTYGAYFRVRARDGVMRWVHTQGFIRRDATGKPRRIIGIVRDAAQELAESAARHELDSERRRRTSLVEGTTAALAHARTVRDVIDVLKDSHGLELLGATSLVMGLHEAGRIHLVAEGPENSFVPGTRYTRVDEPYPMSEVIRTLAPRFIESPEDFATSYPGLWPHISGLGITAAAYLPLIAQARPACCTATRRASPPTSATSWSPSAAPSPRACSAPCSTNRSTIWPRDCSRPCCRAGYRGSRGPRSPSATARPASARTSEATGTT
jgi:PAS domain S-box-containing protein